MRYFASTIVVAGLIAFSNVSLAAWDQPGSNPYRGSRWHAVMSYGHIPVPVRVRLALRMQWFQPDYVVEIDRYGLRPQADLWFTDGIRDMHFGRRQRVAHVTMAGWTAEHRERAPLWCEGEWCVGAPFVCRNVFWTTREVVMPSMLLPASELSEPRALGVFSLLCVFVLTYRARK